MEIIIHQFRGTLSVGRVMAICASLLIGGQVVAQEKYVIAYNVLADAAHDDYDIFTMQLDGSNKKNITNTRGVDWTYKAGNQQILFISDRDTCYRCFYLHTMDADGNGIKQITDFRLADSWMDTRMDGNQIVLTPHKSVDSALYVIDRLGKVLNKIYTGMPMFTDPAFIPGKDRIVFRAASTQFKRDIGYDDELYTINLDGSDLTQITHYPTSDTTRPWHAYHAGPDRKSVV